MLKKPLKLFIGLIIILGITIVWLLSDFNPIYKSEEFVNLTHRTKEAQKENLKAFTDIYQKISPKMKEKKCPCDRATNYIGPYRHGYSLTKSLYQFKIESQFTQTDCFKYLLLNTDFKSFRDSSKYKTFGVKEASKFYFNKNVKELNEKEALILIAMLKNPSLYDLVRNKEGVKNRVKVLETILHKQSK